MSDERKNYENSIREDELRAVAEKLGDEAAEAMREYLTLFDERCYIWMANLYDPETGALYYSNSARDNVSGIFDGKECMLLPDLESTPRGYGWLSSVGMLRDYGGSLGAALPEWLKEKLIKWTQGLQSSEDGYFYHPQWGKNISVSRRGRDLDTATRLLTQLGGDILYDTANGHRGTLGAPAVMQQAEGDSTDILRPDHLRTPAALREYLATFDWENRSYQSSHTLESQWAQIKAAGQEIIDTYKQYLDEQQEKMQEKLRNEAEAALLAAKPDATPDEIAAARRGAENGLLEHDVKYAATNGLMKTCSTYSRIGLRLNYIEQAFESALKMVVLEGPDADGKLDDAIVNVFNPWVAINHLINNAVSFGEPETAERLRARLRERAPELIRITKRKVAKFHKPDGSYGYCQVGVPALSQMAPVAIPGTDEGDVNGGTIATSGIFGHMCEALGIKRPSFYFGSDFEKFIAIIEKKNEEYLKSKAR